MTVAHLNGARADGGGFGVVGDHDDRLVEFLVKLFEHIQHDLRVLCIEVSRRLVREDYGRSIDHRPGQSHTLLLTAGKLQRLVMHLVLELKQPQDLAAAFGRDLAIAGVDLLSELEISLGRQSREKVEPLKYKPDLTPADVGSLGVRNFSEVFAVDDDTAARRRQKPAQQMEERGFTASRRPHYRYEFSLIDRQRDAAKRRHLDLSDLVRLLKIYCLKDGHWAGYCWRAPADFSDGRAVGLAASRSLTSRSTSSRFQEFIRTKLDSANLRPMSTLSGV